MIVFDLECAPHGHRFEGWFGSSEDYTRQQQRGLLMCPECGATEVDKALMAPHLGRKGNQLPETAPARTKPAVVPPVPAAPAAAASAAPPSLPPEARAALQALAKAQAEALKSSRWVGDGFADSARAMHYGDRDIEAIHGQATPEQARALLDEGVEIAPLLFPVAPPGEVN